LYGNPVAVKINNKRRRRKRRGGRGGGIIRLMPYF
tara:strand:+ start:89 stop:193 length:105 start_codon:yes stop_codon:yes gene_type:complete